VCDMYGSVRVDPSTLRCASRRHATAVYSLRRSLNCTTEHKLGIMINLGLHEFDVIKRPIS
jgi:hypothetical protein